MSSFKKSICVFWSQRFFLFCLGFRRFFNRFINLIFKLYLFFKCIFYCKFIVINLSSKRSYSFDPNQPGARRGAVKRPLPPPPPPTHPFSKIYLWLIFWIFLSNFKLVFAVPAPFQDLVLFFVYVFCWNNEHILVTVSRI